MADPKAVARHALKETVAMNTPRPGVGEAAKKHHGAMRDHLHGKADRLTGRMKKDCGHA